MSERRALITGANGGVGQVLCCQFRDAGWSVLATDRHEHGDVPGTEYVSLDLLRLCDDEAYRAERLNGLRSSITGGLHALINNAALQVLGDIQKLSVADWQASMNVNVLAPFVLVQAFLPDIEAAQGCVINIGSIHAQLTKPRFATYAASKSALAGLTRALAVELGQRIRVNSIQPAAIETAMLRSGFVGNQEGFESLALHHPSACIGEPELVARAALFLAREDSAFLNGVVLNLDGGVASRLHDPD